LQSQQLIFNQTCFKNFLIYRQSCFKFRNKIGLDIALEALRDAWKQNKVTMDELWEAAQLCRVANVMRPYLESLV
jgi:hypothetical protein